MFIRGMFIYRIFQLQEGDEYVVWKGKDGSLFACFDRASEFWEIIKKLTNHLKSQHVPVTVISLRKISFNSVDTLVDTLKDATNSWLDQFKQVAQHFQLDAKVYGFEVKVKIEGLSSHPIRRLNDLLSKFKEKLPHFTFWHGRKIPVFIIDEANELRALLKDPHEHNAIHNFSNGLSSILRNRGDFTYYWLLVTLSSTYGYQS